MTWERCGCGAAIFTFSGKRAADWRVSHNHDIGAMSQDSDIPTVIESMSSHERAMPFGFAMEPEGGWHE